MGDGGLHLNISFCNIFLIMISFSYTYFYLEIVIKFLMYDIFLIFYMMQDKLFSSKFCHIELINNGTFSTRIVDTKWFWDIVLIRKTVSIFHLFFYYISRKWFAFLSVNLASIYFRKKKIWFSLSYFLPLILSFSSLINNSKNLNWS